MNKGFIQKISALILVILLQAVMANSLFAKPIRSNEISASTIAYSYDDPKEMMSKLIDQVNQVNDQLKNADSKQAVIDNLHSLADNIRNTMKDLIAQYPDLAEPGAKGEAKFKEVFGEELVGKFFAAVLGSAQTMEDVKKRLNIKDDDEDLKKVNQELDNAFKGK